MFLDRSRPEEHPISFASPVAERRSASAKSREAMLRIQRDLLEPALVRKDGDLHLGARNIYTDPELFELELTHLFEGGWVFAAHESQMPKPFDFMTMSIGRQPILLTRDAEGRVGGFFNACLHRGARVCREKVGNRKVHMCRFHGWCYNAKGDLVNVSGEKDGAYPVGFDRKDLGLVPVPKIASHRGFVFVSLNPAVPSLQEYLGDAVKFIDLLVDQSPTGELEVVRGETSYTYSGNWKLATENGVDGYHVPTVHQNYLMTVAERAKAAPTTTKTFDISKWGQGEAGFFGFRNGHALLYGPYFNYEDRPSYPFYEHYAKTLSVEHADWIVKRFRNFLLFPNVLLMDQMSSQIRLVRPITVDLTEVVTWCIAPKGEAAAAREKRIRQYEDFFNASGMATPDDMAEFRNCQIGYGAASSVPYSDLSRGQQRWVKGPNETAKRFDLNPILSSSQTSDEGIYVAIIDQWRERMAAAVEAELEKTA